MSSTISHQSFPISLFAQLARRLRHANARYIQIAYQCRRSQCPTYHAKRRASRAGLRIDTSKAAVWPDDDVQLSISSAASTPSLYSDDTSSPRAIGTAAAAEYVLPNPWCKSDPAQALSPLDLDLCTWGADTCDLPFGGRVPGAPRWRTRPLPEDEHASDDRGVARTYDRVWRAHVAGSEGYAACLGSTVPGRGVKRARMAEGEA